MERCVHVCILSHITKFTGENYGKLPVGKTSPGEFREIRETSRRGKFPPENFGKSGKLPVGKISYAVLWHNTLFFFIKMLSKRVLCTRNAQWIYKVSPQENHLRFTKTGGNFFRGKFPRNFPGKCRDIFSRKSFSCKSFSCKYYGTNVLKVGFTDCNRLYMAKLIVILWWNFVVKISRRENFGKSGKLPDGKIPPGISPRIFGDFPETAL